MAQHDQCLQPVLLRPGGGGHQSGGGRPPDSPPAAAPVGAAPVAAARSRHAGWEPAGAPRQLHGHRGPGGDREDPGVHFGAAGFGAAVGAVAGRAAAPPLLAHHRSDRPWAGAGLPGQRRAMAMGRVSGLAWGIVGVGGFSCSAVTARQLGREGLGIGLTTGLPSLLAARSFWESVWCSSARSTSCICSCGGWRG